VGVTQQNLGSGSRGEAHLDAPGGVCRGQERLRPGRVVPVAERLLVAVDGERLRVAHQALHRQSQVDALLDSRLGQHPGATHLRADQDRYRVERREAGHTHGRLDFSEATEGGFSRVRGEEGGVVAEVGDVGLVGDAVAEPHLPRGQHHLEDVEMRDHVDEPGGRQSPKEPSHRGGVGVRVEESSRQLERRESHGLFGHLWIDRMARDESIEGIEVVLAPAVELHDPTGLDPDRCLGIGRSVKQHETGLGPLVDRRVAPDGLLLALPRPLGSTRALSHRISRLR